MLFKYVILVTLVVNSFTDNHLNEVEPSSTAYSEQKCHKTDLNIDGEGEEASPDVDEIGVYETYTLVCGDNFNLVSGDNVAVDIDPVYTCVPGEDAAVLSPTPSANCAKQLLQNPQVFETQVNDGADNIKYAVAIDKLSCFKKNQQAELIPGVDMSTCPNDYQTFIDVGCRTDHNDHIFVGYHSLMVLDNQASSLWGEDIISDPVEKLKLYMDCIAGDQASTVCFDVDTLPSKSDSKLFVKMYSIPVAAGDSSRKEQAMNILQGEDVHYRLRCDDGYSFKAGIEENSVYGYCTQAGTGESKGNNLFFAYTKDAADEQIHCYSKCPANPESTDTFAEGSSPVFGKLFLPSLKKDDTFTLKKEAVVCADGQTLATDAQDSYEITCHGADTTAQPNSGLLSCTDCPVCHAKCPANPESADAFVESPVFRSIVMKELIKGETFHLQPDGVTCAEGQSLAEGAPDQYTITCHEDGKLSCGDHCPICHPKCPANPENADAFVAGNTTVFKSIVMKELIKGETFHLQPDAVTCEDLYSLEVAAPDQYSITCSDDGKLSCGEQCPTCYPMCPEDPNTEKFEEGSDIVFLRLTMVALKKGETHDLPKEMVSCDDDMALAADASASYTITCGEPSGGVGILECDSCPICFGQCLANPTAEKLELAEDSGVESISISENQSLRASITVNKEHIVCKDNYAMPDDAKSTFEFRCKEEGMFSCAEGENGCPQCKGTCEWPAETEGNLGYDFRYVDEAKRAVDREEHAIPGVNHVEAFCTNETHFVILGPRFLSCISNSTMEFDTTGYDNDATPTCQTDPVCESPAATGGTLDRTGNIPVGESYVFTCGEGYMFDLDTQDTLSKGATSLEIPCVEPAGNETLVNSHLPAQICYSGCRKTVGFDGEITPAEKRSGSAPYSEGDTITFTCREGYKHADPTKGEQTCEKGNIGTGAAPVCIKDTKPTEEPGAATNCLVSTILLTVTVLALLL
ncbi:hypothetical protein ACHWQZ_G004763 [Mnemiopsis leidyi]